MISFMGRLSLSQSCFCKSIRKAAHAAFVSVLSAAFVILPFPNAGPIEAQAARGDRTLWLHFTHTGEEKKITFRRNGKYDAKGIKELQWILRDWRRNEATKMDPRLFDLVWSIYQEAGATKAIRVVSAFRSKKTNDNLRRRSRGVAKTSQHTAGRAMDFYIPGVPVKKLREIGLKMQVGGVGYYPGSRTPFVHMDTGNVRHWPRMTPSQVARIFPDGKTLHKDTKGRHAKHYAAALADYKKRQTKVIQPLSKSKRTRFASAKSKPEKKKTGGLLAGLFNGNKNAKSPKVVAASVAKPTIAPIPAPRSTVSVKTPTVIANKTIEPDTTPIPSRIGRPIPDAVAPAVEQAATSVVAFAPTPRPVPSGLRDQFTPQQSIVVASAPTPFQRPINTPDAPVATAASTEAAPQVIVAKADIPREPRERLPRAIDQTSTAALTRKDFDVPTPQVVKNRLKAISDPTRLVLNDKLTKPVKPTLSQQSATELAYANATNPTASLPQLNASNFNNRFGKPAQNTSNVSDVPTNVIKELTASERFAALHIQEKQSAFSLKDIGIESKERQLALRKSLGFSNEATRTADNQPAAQATAHSAKQAALKTARSQSKKESHSLTNKAGGFTFAGEGKQIVQTLLASASIVDVPIKDIKLPKPSHMPSLFVQPTRVYAGAFSIKQVEISAASFTGDTITVTPTVKFDSALKIRLSALSL